MKKFLIKVSMFFLFMLIVAFCLDYIVTKGLRKTEFDKFAEWTHIFKGEINADILISGSSRAWWHYSPKVFEDKTKCSTYNIGMNGSTFYLQYHRYQTYKKYNKEPKILILNLDDFSFEKRDFLSNKEQFLPYFQEETITKPIFTYNTFDFWDKNLPFYRYIGEYNTIKVGLLEFFNLRHYKNNNYKGFEGQKKTWTDQEVKNLKNFTKLKAKVDADSVKLFNKFIKDTKASGTKLVLVYSPFYVDGQSIYSNHNEIMQMYKKFANENDLPFFDYSKHDISKRKELFHNAMHLNYIGADLFSKDLAMSLLNNGLQPCQ